jgi:hypothetical protein
MAVGALRPVATFHRALRNVYDQLAAEQVLQFVGTINRRV